jgi:seryl-tRNA synthetase|tara:strand:- start:9786 stop:11033 length:1248 start_codon:yes stop_codon:yes gene_type:complete
MHNIKDIRKNLDFYKKKIAQRNSDINFDVLIKLDGQNRELIQHKEKKEQEKKLLSKSKDPSNFELSKKLTSEIDTLLISQNKLHTEIFNILSNIPNIAHEEVPIGEDEKSNKLVHRNGNIREFDFTIKSHVVIGEINNQIDFKNSSKLSGSRFVILKSNFALLERALINFMLDIHINKFSYTEISPPLLVNENVMFGTGQLPKFEEDQFEIKLSKDEERKFLIPTAEVVLTNLVRDSIIDSKLLPLRYVAATPCFRKEAGTYGKDTKGMMRQHQFYKVELVSIIDPKNSSTELDRMLACAEEILKLLKIPYQVVLLCSGDMGFSAEKTFDIEAWIPSEKKYREISSCSSCGSFQARRMNAKFKSSQGTDYLGTLNGSALAVGRLMISLIENYQNPDGSVTIPSVLKKYMNNLDKI